jgi:hypothetical protein
MDDTDVSLKKEKETGDYSWNTKSNIYFKQYEEFFETVLLDELTNHYAISHPKDKNGKQKIKDNLPKEKEMAENHLQKQTSLAVGKTLQGIIDPMSLKP